MIFILLNLLNAVLATFTVVVIFVLFCFYIRKTLKHKCIPQPFSWLSWTFINSVNFILTLNATLKSGANDISYPAFFIAINGLFFIMPLIIFLLSLKYGEKNNSGFDFICFCICIMLSCIPFFTPKLVIINFLFAAAYLAGLAPTFRKSYYLPFSEPLGIYYIFSLIGLFAAFPIPFVIKLTNWPLSIAIAFSLLTFCATIIWRRRQVALNSAV